MLRRLLAEAGCESSTSASSRDDEATLEAVLRDAAATCDAIVTSGGVSMGDYDVVKAVLGRIAEMRWMQIAIKPAKPFAFGTLDGIAGLRPAGQPGQLAGQLRAARPAGAAPDDGPPPTSPAPSVVGVADDELRRQPDGKVHFVRVDGDVRRRRPLHVAPVGAQGSHQLAATALADALAVAARRRRRRRPAATSPSCC